MLGTLGRGGMGEVMLARLRQGPDAGREVAVKTLAAEFRQDVATVRQFLEEADLGRQLEHENVIRVLGTGQANDVPFIVMERIDGLDLRAMIDQLRARSQNLPIAVVVHIARGVALALRYVHQASSPAGAPLGLVHCDVTPGNIYVTRSGRVVLSDFGAAAATGMGGDSAVPAGKARYMSPEQILGQPLRPSTDMFALGAVLFELLTRHRAFSGVDTNTVWDKIIARELVPPSSLRTDVPPEMDALVAESLGARLGGSHRGSRWWRSLRGRRGPRLETADEFVQRLNRDFDLPTDTPAQVGRWVRKLLLS